MTLHMTRIEAIACVASAIEAVKAFKPDALKAAEIRAIFEALGVTPDEMAAALKLANEHGVDV